MNTQVASHSTTSPVMQTYDPKKVDGRRHGLLNSIEDDSFEGFPELEIAKWADDPENFRPGILNRVLKLCRNGKLCAGFENELWDLYVPKALAHLDKNRFEEWGPLEKRYYAFLKHQALKGGFLHPNQIDIFRALETAHFSTTNPDSMEPILSPLEKRKKAEKRGAERRARQLAISQAGPKGMAGGGASKPATNPNSPKVKAKLRKIKQRKK